MALKKKQQSSIITNTTTTTTTDDSTKEDYYYYPYSYSSIELQAMLDTFNLDGMIVTTSHYYHH